MSSESSASSPTILRTEELAPSTDDGGLLKEVYVEGSGELPESGFEVTAHYTGRLLDGSVFDSSVERGTPFKFTLGTGGVIKGWDQGFATMRKGEKAFLTCGPGYAYGARGSPPKIPAGATLRFEVELLNFGPKKKESWEMSSAEKVAEAEKATSSGLDPKETYRFHIYRAGNEKPTRDEQTPVGTVKCATRVEVLEEAVVFVSGNKAVLQRNGGPWLLDATMPT